MNNNYNYYPNRGQNRLDYNQFIDSLGLNNMGMDPFMNMPMDNANVELFGSYEGYTKGNMFKNKYMQYKNYKPQRIVPTNPEEEALLNLNQMHFAMHEANLYLDVFPNDTNMIRQYIKYRDQYNRLLNEYQNKFGALNVNSNDLNGIPFGWEEEKFPWDRRGL